jgi:phospholipase/carboxylesterase
MQIPSSIRPHGNEAVLVTGNTTNPTKALILLHGRGATAQDILSLTDHLNLPDNTIVLAPEAVNNTWYPERFIKPQEANQPDLDSALARIAILVTNLETEFNIPTEHIALAGFSQGACLTAEYLKRNPMRYLAAAIYSGGLIGTETEVQEQIEGSLASTPIYIGCDEVDFHIPAERVRTTATYLTEHNAEVTLRLYTGLGHTIHPEGLEFLKEVMR